MMTILMTIILIIMIIMTVMITMMIMFMIIMMMMIMITLTPPETTIRQMSIYFGDPENVGNILENVDGILFTLSFSMFFRPRKISLQVREINFDPGILIFTFQRSALLLREILEARFWAPNSNFHFWFFSEF